MHCLFGVALKAVTIASGATTIGKSAFYACNSLTRIDIPESVNFIGNVKSNDNDLNNSYVFYNHPSSLTIFGNSSFLLSNLQTPTISNLPDGDAVTHNP